MIKRTGLAILFLIHFLMTTFAQGITISGVVTDQVSRKPVEFASVLLKETQQWAITDEAGKFTVRDVPRGGVTLTVQCLGYIKQTLTIQADERQKPLTITLQEENLKLEEVEVVAKRRSSESTTSFTMDRTTLDHQQLLNITDLNALLPGGKTVNSSLMNDDRLALRAGTSEKGNAAFGTAIEVDGVRMSNNASMEETMSTSTRNLSSSNIESVEVVEGIASVEYGDLSNGVVKVNTRKGKSPLILEVSMNPHTRQLAINKGMNIGRKGGVLNVSMEHARSFSDIASPHTAYQRNILSLHYMTVFMRDKMPLTLNAGFTGNIGGYNSEADPDAFLDTYSKSRDNLFSGNMELNWLLNKSWITNLTLKGSISYQDKRAENYANASSTSSQPYIHSMQEGYFIATDYDTDPSANIILGPTGYWYVRNYHDSKPVNYALRLKGAWTHYFASTVSALKVGADFTGSYNKGRGVYYEDMRYAPTWREYRYDELPVMNNIALYAEEKLTLPVLKESQLQLTAGIRDDITLISGSDYGTVSSFSPRFSGKFIFWRDHEAFVRDLSMHAGWGKSVKLPSFQVLYPSPSYSDKLAFTPASTADNRSYYAYYTHPSQALYSPELKWQYTNQTDLGVDVRLPGVRLSVSGFYHKTCYPYASVSQYTPFTYYYTGQSALENCEIPSAYRSYSIHQQTGVVTVTDQTGTISPVELSAIEHHTYHTNRRFTNGSSTTRYGFEWVLDFDQIKALHTSFRFDGNYYYYKGLDQTLFAANAGGIGDMTGSTDYPLIGYYRGTSATSAATTAYATISNGSVSKALNLNATITNHIPRVRMIVTLRIEASLYNWKRSLSELDGATRGIVLDKVTDYTGMPYDGTSRNQYVALYPEYYTTWDAPDNLIPFAERFEWAKANDQTLYNQLARMIVKTNYAYTLNPNRISSYFSANFSVTKEIGDHVSVSFYANNFFNNLGSVRSSQTGLNTSLFDSGYIPKFYYGLSLRVKI